MDSLLVTFPVSSFGYMPRIIKASVWNEIYEAYQDELMGDFDDDLGQTVEIDLCECVKNAIVTPNPSDDMVIWASSIDTQFFFNHICLHPDTETWTFHLDLNRKVAPLFEQRGAQCDAPQAVGLGTVSMIVHLGDSKKEVTLTVSYDENKEQRCVYQQGDEEFTFTGDYTTQIKNHLAGIKLNIPETTHSNVRERLVDTTQDLDLSAFDNLPLDAEE